MHRLLAALPLLALLQAPPAAAQEGPSFDCAKAATKVEKQICDDWTLSAYDRWVAQLYKELRAKLIAEFQEALKHEQREWLKGDRNACEKAKADALWSCVYRAYQRRAVQLSQSQEVALDLAEPPDGWSGAYAYDDGHSQGAMTLLRFDAGFTFQISSVTGQGSHICDLTGEGAESNGDLMVWQESGGSCAITFAKTEDGSVRVSSNGCAEWCGANGYFDADYSPQP